jgi:hypothetical protein
VYWIGDPSKLNAFGAHPKSLGPATIKQFERWLRHIGAKRVRTGKHVRVELPNGRRASYATSAGILLPPEASQIAEALGLNKRDLLGLVHRMEGLEAH